MNSKLNKLKRIRLGDYIERSSKNNKNLEYGTELIEGVTSEGVFSVPKGNVEDVNLKPYKIVNNGAFVYNPSRLNIGSISYRTQGLCIVSHLYIVFYLNKLGKEIIDPEYLYIYLRRDEFRREVTFRNFGSQRPEFNFNDMSEIVLYLPDLSIQKKYAAIYRAMTLNQKNYEQGLDDLKLTCDMYIENLRREMITTRIGDFIEEINQKNSNLDVKQVQGVNSTSCFGDTKADTSGVDLKNYKIVERQQFAYNPSRINLGSIALLQNDRCVVSPMYVVFKVSKPKLLLPEYLMLWLGRKEFQRSTKFYATGSVRDTFSFEAMKEVQIPIPTIETQQYIVEIYNVYQQRKSINEKIKVQIKDICPILIKGSLEEAGL